MKLRDAIAAGILHLSQNRLRAGLSILGIFIGIASVLCMMAIGDSAKLFDKGIYPALRGRYHTGEVDKLGGENQFQFEHTKKTGIWWKIKNYS